MSLRGRYLQFRGLTMIASAFVGQGRLLLIASGISNFVRESSTSCAECAEELREPVSRRMASTYVAQRITYILLSKPYINTFVRSWQSGVNGLNFQERSR
jgi:hypothetical protein